MLKIYINASFPKLIQNLSLSKYLNYHLLHSFDLTFFSREEHNFLRSESQIK